MKKLVTAFALCAAFSAYAQVESANVVGYNTIPITQRNTMIGMPFENTDSTGMQINDAFPYTPGNGMTPGTFSSNSDQIQIGSIIGGSYTVYWLSNKSNITSNKWTTAGGTVVATAVLEPGSVAWYVSRTADTTNALTHWNLVTKGQVLADATSTRVIKAGIPSLISNPYPIEYNINSENWVDKGGKAGAFASTADQIQVRTSTGSYIVYWLSNKANVTSNKWTTAGGTALPANPIIPAGQSAWYISRGSNDVTWVANTPL